VIFVYRTITEGEHRFTVETKVRPGDPLTDVREADTFDIGRDAVVYVWGNARYYIWGQARVHIFGNAEVYVWGRAQVHIHGSGIVHADEHAQVFAAGRDGTVKVFARGRGRVVAALGAEVFAYAEVKVFSDEGVPVKLHGYALNHTAHGVAGNTDIYRGGYYRLPL
jgi:hypothetical protein